MDNTNQRKTFHKHKNSPNSLKNRNYNDTKGFTLTDHFKNYKRQIQDDSSEPSTDNDQLSLGSLQNTNDFMEFKKNF